MRILQLFDFIKKVIMKLSHVDNNNNVTERYIRVLEVNDTSILAYCYYRKKVRTFKLKNILSTGPVRKRVGA
ncbi:hypothetical protein GCM10008934_02100 [Virgibacillus salarius]